MIILYTSLAIAFLALMLFEYDKQGRKAKARKRTDFFNQKSKK